MGDNAPMHLLERQPQLDTLHRCFQESTSAAGKLVLIAAEAGLGKSALIELFAYEHRRDAHTLWGACDALATPRPLAPVHEIASQTRTLAGQVALDDGARDGLFRAIFDELANSERPSIVVLEDLHWADEATLDFLRYMGRRIQRTRALFLATYRDDEFHSTHPVRLAIGELTGHHVLRMRLAPLSPAAVDMLAKDSGRDAALLHQITGGNPFFIRELLASVDERVPETVRDAVLARLARCSPATRELAELVCISPSRSEVWLIDAVLGARPAAIDEAGARGLLAVQTNSVGFRHELARLAVLSSLAPEAARAMHERVLKELIRHGAELARLVHHAVRAHDTAAVLDYAPRAARQAARLGAHREAAAHLAEALSHRGVLDAGAQAELLEEHALECSLANRPNDAIRSAGEAAAIRRDTADADAESRLLCFLSQEYRNVGDRTRADDSVGRAIAVFEGRPPSQGLASAYNARALLGCNRGWDKEALEFAHRALEISRQFEDRALESQALCNLGAARLGRGDRAGYEPLERSLALTLEHGLVEQAGRAYRTMLFYAVLLHDFERAEALFRDAIAYCEEHGLFSHSAYVRAYYTPAELERGRWTDAARTAVELLRSAEIAAVQQRITVMATLALVRLRRGDPGADELLDEALALALPTGEINRIGRVAAARAEAAWLKGHEVHCESEAQVGLSHVSEHAAPWIKGELTFWRSRAQPVASIAENMATPYRLMIEGRWREAALEWESLGMPYERALALADGDEPALRDALAILDALGAVPLASIVRRRLRERGVRQIPRGPNEATRANPAGLTAKEVEVLILLAQGSSNAQLARRLHRSTKTIDHHVSAILEKLGARSRTEAVATAFSLGLVDSPKGAAAP